MRNEKIKKLSIEYMPTLIKYSDGGKASRLNNDLIFIKEEPKLAKKERPF